MAIQLSVPLRNLRLNQLEIEAGEDALLQIFEGALPADCAAADTGPELVSMALPQDWMNDASGGTKTLLGVWSGTAALSGTATHFRIKDSIDSKCVLQGSCGDGGSEDLVLDNATIASSQTVTVSTFTLTDANA